MEPSGVSPVIASRRGWSALDAGSRPAEDMGGVLDLRVVANSIATALWARLATLSVRLESGYKQLCKPITT
jgi:hypothetical protein